MTKLCIDFVIVASCCEANCLSLKNRNLKENEYE